MSFSILIVDDHEVIAEALAKLLDSLGHSTTVACSGQQALKVVYREKPDIVLLDIGMPGMDGYEVARGIRNNPDSCETILVALTGHGQMEDRLKAREAGFNHHIDKPATLDEINRIINVYDF